MARPPCAGSQMIAIAGDLLEIRERDPPLAWRSHRRHDSPPQATQVDVEQYGAKPAYSGPEPEAHHPDGVPLHRRCASSSSSRISFWPQNFGGSSPTAAAVHGVAFDHVARAKPRNIQKP